MFISLYRSYPWLPSGRVLQRFLQRFSIHIHSTFSHFQSSTTHSEKIEPQMCSEQAERFIQYHAQIDPPETRNSKNAQIDPQTRISGKGCLFSL